MSDYPSAIDYFVDRSRVFINQNSHDAIILHGTGGNPAQTAQQLGDYFRTTPEETSVHYGIDRAGVICQYVLEVDGAGGNGILEPGHDALWDQLWGNPNVHTISIEHENDSSNSLPLTDAQKQASFALISYLCKKYALPVSRVLPHSSIAPQSRANCPGPAYPWDELRTFLQGGQNMGVPNGWHDDGTTLTAPNGIPVVMGFRQYILAHQWSPDNFPVEIEHEQSPLEISNPALGKGAQQLFRMSMLGYTQALGVFEEYIGVELLAMRAQVASIPNFAAIRALATSQHQALAQIGPLADQIGQIAKQFEAS